jgi:hypothetical protein
MGSEGEYRAKAAELAARMKDETNPAIRLDLQRLSASYLRLADQARVNSRTDVVEAPMQNQPTQAQQTRLKDDE